MSSWCFWTGLKSAPSRSFQDKAKAFWNQSKTALCPQNFTSPPLLILSFSFPYIITHHNRFFAFQSLFTQQHKYIYNIIKPRGKAGGGGKRRKKNVPCKHSFCWQTGLGLGGGTQMVALAGINHGCCCRFASCTKNWNVKRDWRSWFDKAVPLFTYEAPRVVPV